MALAAISAQGLLLDAVVNGAIEEWDRYGKRSWPMIGRFTLFARSFASIIINDMLLSALAAFMMETATLCKKLFFNALCQGTVVEGRILRPAIVGYVHGPLPGPHSDTAGKAQDNMAMIVLPASVAALPTLTCVVIAAPGKGGILKIRAAMTA